MKRILENPYPTLMTLRMLVMICMASANFFIIEVNVIFNLMAICVYVISTFFIFKIERGFWILFVIELLISLIFGVVYVYTDFPYPLLVGLVGLGVFLYYQERVFILIWSIIFFILLTLELIFSLHPPMQIIINYSFVVFASATGGLIRYAYRMKNQTMKLYKELENSYQKLREHADTVEQLTMQEERNRISREIHDTVGHTVTALIFQLEAAQKFLSIDQKKSISMMKTSEELARSIYRDIRFSIEENDRSNWAETDLDTKFRQLIQKFSRFTELEVSYETKGNLPSFMSRKYTFGLYRILQETLTNAKRHGDAKSVWVRLCFSAEQLQLDIWDDGIGCDHLQKGFGLKNLQNRVKELNGTCSFFTEKGKGFKTRVVIPVVQREVAHG
jgi:signal transduction histidine kinase